MGLGNGPQLGIVPQELVEAVHDRHAPLECRDDLGACAQRKTAAGETHSDDEIRRKGVSCRDEGVE